MGLCIANGRCGNDVYIGRNTCNNTSLLYYVLLSPVNFKHVSEFNINDFDPLYSDVHSCITFNFCNSLSNGENSVADVLVVDHNNLPSTDTDNVYVSKKPVWNIALSKITLPLVFLTKR